MFPRRHLCFILRCPVRCHSKKHRGYQAGFTLIELVMVILVTGILAVVAIPRFASRDAFDVSGFAEQTRAVLRAAQKTAIGQHRNVSVDLDASGRKLSACYDTAYPCASPVADPVNGVALSVIPNATVTFTTSTAQITFDWRGSPNGTAATLSISPAAGGNAISVNVDADTGYVQ